MKKLVFKSIMFIALLIVMQDTLLNAQDLQSAIKLTRSEQFYKADKIFRSLIAKNPEDANAYYYYGDNYLQKYFSDTLTYSYIEMADSAKSLFQTGISKVPENPLNYVGLGEIELINKKNNEAQAYFDKAISKLPSKTNKTSMLSKKEQAIVMIKMANAYLKARSEDTATVFRLLRDAEKLDNKNFDLFITKGDAYLQMLNNGSNAIKNYNQAQYLNPTSPRAKLRLGQLWVRAKNYASAIDYYKEAITIDSNYAPAYREMGYLLFKARQPEKANQYYTKFLSLSAGSKIARIQYINTLIELQDYTEAINQINIIMNQDSSNNDFNRALAYSYYETGKYDKGLYYITKFFSMAQSDKIRTLDFVYYGKLLSKNNMDSLSGKVLMEAFDMDTTQIELMSQAISSYLKIKDYNRAAEIVIRKTMMNKDVAYDYYTLGKIYYGQNEWKKADSAFSIFLSLSPSDVKGCLWKAYSLVNMDPDSKQGLAKPAFEILIENAKSDSVKYSNELKQAYSYLSYYYLLQFNKTKKTADGQSSKQYCEKVLMIDPADENAKTILKDLNVRIK